MTAVEFRLFFETLPEKQHLNQELPTRRAFSLESGVSAWVLKEIIHGSRPLNEHLHDKLLPVVRKYGFQG